MDGAMGILESQHASKTSTLSFSMTPWVSGIEPVSIEQPMASKRGWLRLAMGLSGAGSNEMEAEVDLHVTLLRTRSRMTVKHARTFLLLRATSL